MMTRKDYVAVSQILSDYAEAIEPDEYFTMCLDFAKYMALDNDRFDTYRFLEACGINIKGMVATAMDPKPATSHTSLT